MLHNDLLSVANALISSYLHTLLLLCNSYTRHVNVFGSAVAIPVGLISIGLVCHSENQILYSNTSYIFCNHCTGFLSKRESGFKHVS